MTTDELRALDEIVARAMGHRLDTCYTGRRIIWPSSGESTIALPRYSTDAACIPEMVAWLRERGQVTIKDIPPHEIELNGRGVYGFLEHYDSPRTANGFIINSVSSGTTISEALARLCVAVADAERERGEGAK